MAKPSKKTRIVKFSASPRRNKPRPNMVTFVADPDVAELLKKIKKSTGGTMGGAVNDAIRDHYKTAIAEVLDEKLLEASRELSEMVKLVAELRKLRAGCPRARRA